MDSSRIFVKNLPPSISEHDFKKHFSANSQITDSKLIPHRRIGYVGYKTPEEAQKAVKYFNKTFIRMSKLAVEIARPISDPTLPTSRKAQREHAREARQAEKEATATELEEAASLKRKRTEVDATDSKLQEFLEVMQPASKSRRKTSVGAEDRDNEDRTQILELPEAESDDEYEAVPKKVTKLSEPSKPVSVAIEPLIEEEQPQVAPSGSETAETPAPQGDSDWLRSHTSRLLDIVDADELPVSAPVTATAVPTAQDEESSITQAPEPAEPIIEDGPEEAEWAGIADETDATIESIKSNGRLFVRNLPYTGTEDDLRQHFGKYGTLEECHLCLDSAGVSKGFSFIQFEDPEAAAEAFHQLDGEPFQGRLIQILPAATKRENKIDEFALAKLPLKKQREIKKKQEAGQHKFTWNSLYMNQDAINSSMANRLGVSKSELLDPTSADAAVKQAIAETSIIQESKNYFKTHGVDLNAFKSKERGDTTILAKNFPFGTTLEELRTMFEEHGKVIRVLMPPTGTIAIIEFAQAPQARAAYSALAYRKMKSSMLFLEKGPKDLFTGAPVMAAETSTPSTGKAIEKVSAGELLEAENVTDTTTLFVRNLNFSTSSQRLTDLFKPLEGFMSARVKTKTDPKKPGQVLSCGFGFLEFRDKVAANTALQAMNGFELEGHKLLIKASHKGLDAAAETREADRAKKAANKRTKVIVKNLAFEATKQDVRALLSAYGKLRSVRLPKKFDNSTRGFAFAEFVSPREAENALESLQNSHLLGRHLVIDYAAEDVVDAEEEIERMQKKVGKQVNKVAMQKLTGGGRKKFNVEGDGDEE